MTERGWTGRAASVVALAALAALGSAACDASGTGDGDAQAAAAAGADGHALIEVGDESVAGAEPAFRTGTEPVDSLIEPRETHLSHLRQLTFGGQNAEAYFSPDDGRLIFQATPRDGSCDQQYTMRTDGTDLRLVSTGKGRTTCGYYVPGSEWLVYSSTHLAGDACPPEPDRSQGYVWAVYPSYDVFVADSAGGTPRRLTETPGYDAEATLSRDGQWIVFTSARDGDLDIYKMRVDGSEVTRLTDEPGYDGGPFFSYDGTKIVYRASRPAGEEALADYRRLLGEGLIRPSQLDLWVMDADGSNKRRLTDNGAANFGPYFHPDGKRVIFSSNMGDPQGREFDLWMIGVDGKELEQVTFTGDFDGFPMFNSDASQLAFASNRGNEQPHETNLFLADWVD